MTTEQTLNTDRARGGRLRFTFVIAALSLLLLVVALVFSAWTRNSEREANMPVPAIESVVLALRAFHQQTGK
ncbi:MAG: hypothetical protein M3430_15020, partial [Acidobacteriota bacterium]|nr:hypothetical protein [Acidobacteriota bacterium]